MSYSMQQSHHQKQMQHLMVSQKMQQAIHVLQLPMMELSQTLHEELALNPIMEPMEHDVDEEVVFKRVKRRKEPFLESLYSQKTSLFDHLLQQAHEALGGKRDREIAETLIGNFDERGFLTEPLDAFFSLKDLRRAQEVLGVIQTFDPKGVGASSLQESLLLQLKGSEHLLAYTVFQNHFQDLLKNRIPVIEKALNRSAEEIMEAVKQEMKGLTLAPGAEFSSQPAQCIRPDVTIREWNGELFVDIDADFLPEVRVNPQYMKLLEDPAVPREDKDFVKEKLSQVKWLVRSVDQRFRTLERIAHFLIQRQKRFFLMGDGKLKPLRMKEVADALEVHESTIARAVANKYIECPRGLLPLRYFFTQGLTSAEGEEISSRTVKGAIAELVDAEDKKKPLSDEKLSLLLRERGMPCARRTVAKYRAELGIGMAKQRKRF